MTMNEHDDFPFEPMTIAQLEALTAQYFPSEMTRPESQPAQQGRGVTNRRNPKCPVCEKHFVKGATRQKYCSRSCQQRAYRLRKAAAAQ